VHPRQLKCDNFQLFFFTGPVEAPSQLYSIVKLLGTVTINKRHTNVTDTEVFYEVVQVQIHILVAAANDKLN
jgi:hypothetical protein